ncbi:MAG: OpgC domain-containing protein [Terracidiphilus sp.]
MQFPQLERRPELDALRGLFLVWMTLTHLPTRFSDFVNQPIGFVSAAEGFVFISALLVGRLYMRDSIENAPGVRARLWKRSLKIYGYHLLMLALLFTVAAAFAAHTHKAALNHLLNFYFAHPVVAVVGSVLLLYCPPLLDILPMYVTFLFFTPMLLAAVVRYGWKRILAASGAVWLLAQFGLRDVVHNWIVHLTHLQIPLQETGAFNLFAWQAVWITGLWIGARSAMGTTPFKELPKWAVAVSVAACVFFIGVRHGWLGPHLTQPALGIQLDKWQLGPLRVINLVTFTTVFYWLRRWLIPLVKIEPFLTLGKASLRVFCAHLFFVFVGLALLLQDVGEDVDGQIEQLHGFTAVALLVVTFTSLILIATNEVRKRRLDRARRHKEEPSLAAPNLPTAP